MPVDADMGEQFQVADEHMADGQSGIGDGKLADTGHGGRGLLGALLYPFGAEC